MSLLSVCAVAQPPYPRPYAYAAEKPEPPAVFGGDTFERSIAVDKNVNISLCVTQGNLKITGWNRSEVRVFVKDGSKFAFKVQETNKQNTPTWIMLNSIDAKKGKTTVATECIQGEEIEIDAPINSKIDIKGQETATTIDSVRAAKVRINGGDIVLRNIAEGITATTFEGDVTVDESLGAMTLETTTGNILVFEAGPSQTGDIFKAKTNSGTISLNRLDFRQIEANSISGSVSYAGAILTNGTYSLSTSNGSIRLAIPSNSSCQVIATSGFGTFNSEIPIKLETENIEEGPVKRVVGKMGTGGATLKLTTNSGSIVIKKQ